MSSVETLENSLGMKLVLLPHGKFAMGFAKSARRVSPYETPKHDVTITKAFLLADCPVTQAHYQKVMGRNPSKLASDSQLPVNSVSWQDAITFCNQLSESEGLPLYYDISVSVRMTVQIVGGHGYRLPTEAEWEYACRAGSKRLWCFGDDETKLKLYAWYDENSGETAHPVRKKKPNAFGLYDMHGQVREWCWDWFSDDYYANSPAEDPTGPPSGKERLMRGGCFGTRSIYTRCAVRAKDVPRGADQSYGFRVARDCVARAEPTPGAEQRGKSSSKKQPERPKPKRYTVPKSLAAAVNNCPLKVVRSHGSEPSPLVGAAAVKESMQRVQAGDLDYGAELYAYLADYYGDEGDYWDVWHRIQKTRRLSIDKSVGELDASQCMNFAVWAFEHGEGAAGAAAYRRYLEKPEYGPFDKNNVLYLDYLIGESQYDEVRTTVDNLAKKHGESHWEQTRAAQAKYLQGEKTAGLKQLKALCRGATEKGAVWAQAALVYHRIGEEKLAQSAVDKAIEISRGVMFEKLAAELLETFDLTDRQRRCLRGEEETEEGPSLADRAAQWWSNPGAVFKISKQPTPHWFGGDDFKMPKCKGCKHPVRQWFLVDVRQVKGLAKQLSSWTVLPMLGCADCMVWMGRHDYTVDLDGMQVKLNKVTLDRVKDFSQAFGEYEIGARHFVRLKSLKPKKRPRDEDIEQYCELGPLVGGNPPWYQEPQVVTCRSCHKDMIYVASMFSVREFGAYIPINNESGYQYHFACDKCHTLSVIAQWS